MEAKAKRIILAILTVIVLGPLVFFGSCLAVGIPLFGSGLDGAWIGWFLIFGIPGVLTILVLYLIIKRIYRDKKAGIKNAGQAQSITAN